MGKGFCHYKVGVIVAAILSAMLLIVSDTCASCPEFELFEKAYECYLSNKPEEAAETFRIFLKEFPGSSAKDAAMFLLGKSLIQLKSFDEARKIFSETKQQFPDSPLIRYVDVELEKENVVDDEADKAETGVGDEKAEIEEKETYAAKVQTDQGQQKSQQIFEERKTAPELKLKSKSICSIQLGLFRIEANATAFAKKFKEGGYDAFIYKSTAKDNRMLYRVLIGHFKNMKEAGRLAEDIHERERIDVIFFCR